MAWGTQVMPSYGFPTGITGWASPYPGGADISAAWDSVNGASAPGCAAFTCTWPATATIKNVYGTGMAPIAAGQSFRATFQARLLSTTTGSTIEVRAQARLYNGAGTYIGSANINTQLLNVSGGFARTQVTITQAACVAIQAATAQVAVEFYVLSTGNAPGTAVLLLDDIAGQVGDASAPIVPDEFVRATDEVLNGYVDPRVVGAVGAAPGSAWGSYQSGSPVTRTISAQVPPGVPVTRSARFTGTANDSTLLFGGQGTDPASGNKPIASLQGAGWTKVNPGETYRNAIWVRADYNAASVRFAIYYRDANGDFVATAASTVDTITVGAWQLLVRAFTVPARAAWAMGWPTINHTAGMAVDVYLAAPIDGVGHSASYFDPAASPARWTGATDASKSARPNTTRVLVGGRQLSEAAGTADQLSRVAVQMRNFAEAAGTLDQLATSGFTGEPYLVLPTGAAATIEPTEPPATIEAT